MENKIINITTPSSEHHLQKHNYTNQCFIQASEISRVLEIFNEISIDLQKELCALTNEKFEVKLERKECIISSITDFRKTLPNPNFVKKYNIDEGPLFIQVDPIIINEMLLQRSNDTPITIVTKNVANHYVFNILEHLLNKVSQTPIVEEKDVTNKVTNIPDNCTIDNIIENPKYIFSKSTDSTFRILLMCKCGDSVGYIRVEFSSIAVHYLLEEEWEYDYHLRNNFYEGKNLYVTFGYVNHSQDYIDLLEPGETVSFIKQENEPLDVIYNGRLVATGKGMILDNKTNSVLISEKVSNDNGTYLEQYNTTCCFGATYFTAEQLEELKTNSLIQLDSNVGNLYPLIFNGQIVGMGIVDTDYDLFFTFTLVHKLKTPIPFILMC